MLFRKSVYFAFITILLFACRTENRVSQDIQLGEIDFAVTGDDDARMHFKRGLLLLHSFEYDDAREAFLKAQELDNDFAMAYWGEAMTYNHSLWQRQSYEEAREALDKLAADKEARLALAKTEIEKDFFQAIEILFGEGTKYDRDVAYRDFMEQLTNKYPGNHEVSAFYAISLLASSRNGRDEELYNKSARIAQGIIEENPNHPGALHYLIHSYDDPYHAHLAKTAADSYSLVAPDAAHALHMPSHIYVALGKWDDVINSNIASWNASVNRMQEKKLDTHERSYHAYNWLQYGLLQSGDFEAAAPLLKEMSQFSQDSSSKNARAYLVSMKGAQMVEAGNWTNEIADIDIYTDDLNITKRAGNLLINGLFAYHNEDHTELQNIIDDLSKDRYKEELRVGDNGFAMCSSGGFANKPPSQLDIDMVKVMELELKAMLADLSNNNPEAEALLKEACQLEESLSYSYGPPVIIKPIHEAYGEWLVKQDRYEDALSVFTKALERQPRRLLSIQGKLKVARKLNNQALIEELEKELAVSISSKEREAILL